MLTQSEKEELDRLAATAAKRAGLNDCKDAARSRQMDLRREVNRCEAVATLFASEQFQEMLEDAASLALDFSNVQQDYGQLPHSNASRIERLQLANRALEAEVWRLQQRVAGEQQRENGLVLSLQACESAVNRLLLRKAGLEEEVGKLVAEVSAARGRRVLYLDELLSVGGLSGQEAELLRAGQCDRLVFLLARDAKGASMRQSGVLVELAEQYFLLQQLRAQHESAQRLFSSYSSCESEHDLIAEEAALASQIALTAQRIGQEREGEGQALQDCEEKARREAVGQTQQWIARRLDELEKKKKTVRALLEIVVPGDAAEEAEVREIEGELWRLEEEEKAFRERLRHNDARLDLQ